MNILLTLSGLIVLGVTVIILIVFCVRLLFYFIKKGKFPKKLLIVLLTGMVFIFSIFVYTQYFFTFNNLKGTLQEGPVHSPNGEYTANAYYETYGGAAGGVKIWVEISNHNTNKIVYHSEAYNQFFMKWKDDNTLTITNETLHYPKLNSNITLDIRKEIYHQTGLACQSLLMKKEYKTCFQD